MSPALHVYFYQFGASYTPGDEVGTVVLVSAVVVSLVIALVGVITEVVVWLVTVVLATVVEPATVDTLPLTVVVSGGETDVVVIFGDVVDTAPVVDGTL